MTSHSELISICIPAYNATAYINHALESILKQSYKNWEVIVVEDGTIGETQNIVNSFKSNVKQSVTYIRKTSNTGVSDTRNIAVSFAKGNWIAFLDSDDLWHEHHLSSLVETAIRNTNSNFIHSGSIAFDSESGETLFEEFRYDKADRLLPLTLFTREYSIQPSACMILSSFYKHAGGFNTSLSYCEDLELCFRCARAGGKFAFTGKNTSYYRKHSQGASAHFAKMALGAAEVYSIHADWPEIPKRIRRKYASEHWLAAARLIRSTNKSLAKDYLDKAIYYQWNVKNVVFWVTLKIAS